MAKKNKEQMPAKWDPLMSDMISFKKTFDDMFNTFFSKRPLTSRWPSIWKGAFGWKPEVDLYETGNEVIVKASVPGCDKKDIKINVDNNILTISGEKKEEKEVKKKNFYQKEQQFGSFQRSVTVPQYADATKAKASCEKGMLKVSFPKTKIAGEKGKKIEIT